MSARERDSDTNNQPAASTSSSSPHPQRGGVSHHIKRDDENNAHQQNSKKNKTPKLLSKTTAVVLPLTVVHVLTIAPARLVAAVASVVGFGTSAGLLRTAYAPAMNRCRCHLKTETQWLAESASRYDDEAHTFVRCHPRCGVVLSLFRRSLCFRRRRRRRHAHTTLSFSFSFKQDPRRWFPSSRLRAAKRPPTRPPPTRPPPADVKKAKADDEFLVVYTARDV